MDPGCTNDFIDGLFEILSPYVCGGKLAGAGGGGFAFAVTRDRDAARSLERTLSQRYPGTPVGVWPCAIPDAVL
jgi:galactokinase/mevalonate kinase-like predicted kinase